MTRINLVNVQSLADQHLFAEWREIKMIPPTLRRSMKTRNITDILSKIPKRYTLNTGHVTFFFDKMKFLAERYKLLTDELISRNYNLSTTSPFDDYMHDIPAVFCSKDWAPDTQEIQINVERIMIRINERPDWYRFYSAKTEPAFFEYAYEEYAT